MSTARRIAVGASRATATSMVIAMVGWVGGCATRSSSAPPSAVELAQRCDRGINEPSFDEVVDEREAALGDSPTPSVRPDDRGGSDLHGHAEPATWVSLYDEDQCRALADQLDRARTVARRYAQARDAVAAGYQRIGAFSPGQGTHYLNVALVDDRFEVDRPEMLMYGGVGEDAPVVALSYYVLTPGDAAPPGGFVGPNDRHHGHGKCMFDDQSIPYDYVDPACLAAGGLSVSDGSGWMLHAWVADDCADPLGMFAAVNPRVGPLRSAATPDACPSNGPGEAPPVAGPPAPLGAPWDGAGAVTAAGSHTCALARNGSAWCWGGNYTGQSGTGTTDPSVRPRPVLSDRTWDRIAGGIVGSCAGDDDGRVACWGLRFDPDLSNDGWPADLWPVDRVRLRGLRALAVGAGHACGIDDAAGVSCWGSNLVGQLGVTGSPPATAPVRPEGVGTATAIAANPATTCAVTTASTLRCWGSNEHGIVDPQGTDTGALRPRDLGLRDVRDVSVGITHACAVRTGGDVVCWGRDHHGQLGTGAATDGIASPRAVPGVTGAVAVAAGGYHTCARLDSGAVTCWGDDTVGQTGTAVHDAPRPPTPVEGLADVVDLSAGIAHTCATDRGGALRCWGSNQAGQLGTGTVDNAARPTDIEVPRP